MALDVPLRCPPVWGWQAGGRAGVVGLRQHGGPGSGVSVQGADGPMGGHPQTPGPCPMSWMLLCRDQTASWTHSPCCRDW